MKDLNKTNHGSEKKNEAHSGENQQDLQNDVMDDSQGNEEAGSYVNDETTPFYKSKQNKYVIWGISIVALISIISILSFIFMRDSEESLAQAENIVQNIYLNEDKDFLKENITQQDITEAEQVVASLSRSNRKSYLKLISQAQSKFNALMQLNTLFNSDDLIINGSQWIPLDKLALLPHVTSEVTEAKMGLLNEMEEDPMVKMIQDYHQFALDSLQIIEEGKEVVKSLPSSLSNSNELTEAVEQISAVEFQFQQYIQHPQMSEVNQKVENVADLVLDTFVDQVSSWPYDPNLAKEIPNSPVLSAKVNELPFGMKPLIALTFDDGPNEKFTPLVLDVLAKHNIKATFFVRGDNVDKYPDIAKRIVEEGHIIANHTYNHYDLSTISDQEVIKQFELAQKAIRDATGITPDIYRLPFGIGGERVINLIENMTSILWNVDSVDWKSQDSQKIYDTTMDQLQHHTLLLMHDTHQSVVMSLETLIPELKELGYTFVEPQEIYFDTLYFGSDIPME